MTAPIPVEVDTVINGRWILPIVPRGKVYENCCLIMDKGQIKEIIPAKHAQEKYTAKQNVSLPNHILMPGFVNAHGHAAMSLLRGFADDLPLMIWLEKHIWPAEAEWVSEDFVHQGTQLAIAEMLLSGTTYFSDMYFFPEQTALAAKSAGIKAQITFPVLDFPTAWAKDADDYIHKGLALFDHYKNDPHITIGFGPHAPYTVSDTGLSSISTLASQLEAPVQIHLHETASEVDQSLQQYSMRPIERLEKLGIIGPQTQCVHMTQVTSADIKILAASGASVIHCPESNLKLASGLCPIAKLMDANIAVGLGTDSAASNNDLSMLGELHTAALLAKYAANDASAVNAQEALELATINGAIALGVADSVGSLEPGKAADVIALELNTPSAMPLYDIASNIVYNNRAVSVTHVWVDGHMLVHEKTLLTLNTNELCKHTQKWQDKIQPKRI